MSMFGWSYPAGCTGTPYDDDAPEACPCCGGVNWDEDGGVEINKGAFPYCSPSCADTDAARNRAAADDYAADLEAEERLLQAWIEEDRAILSNYSDFLGVPRD